MQAISETNSDPVIRWNILIDCARSVTKLNPKETGNLQIN